MPGGQYPGHLYYQRYNKDGQPLGINVRNNTDTIGEPRITVLPDGRFILLWVRELRANGGLQYYEFFFQRFDRNGQNLGLPVSVLDTAFLVINSVTPAGFSISSSINGRFIICWSKGHVFNSYRKVFFQRYDSSGARIGMPDSVNEANSRGEFPDIAMNDDGSFVIVWQDDRENPGTLSNQIYMQRYSSAGQKTGNKIKISDASTGSQYRAAPDVSTNGFKYYVITWIDPRACGFGEVYYQLIDTNGSMIGVNRKANNTPCGNSIGANISVKMRKDKKFFIYWSDCYFAGREQSYGRRFDSLGNPIGLQYMIPLSSPNGTTQRANDCDIFGDRVYATWHDNRNGGTNNYDIYCNVRGFQNPDTTVSINNSNEVIGEFILYPAYPNPFNPNTNIKYQISAPLNPPEGGRPGKTFVQLKIYDIRGREILTLVNQFQEAGTYEVKFNGLELSSGIYFILLINNLNFKLTQKLVLVK